VLQKLPVRLILLIHSSYGGKQTFLTFHHVVFMIVQHALVARRTPRLLRFQRREIWTGFATASWSL